MGLGSSGSEFDFRWKLNLGNIAKKKNVRVSLTSKK